MQETGQDVRWRGTLEEARDEARRDGKLVLIFLWHHNCGGSKTMDVEPYRDDGVRSYVEHRLVPVRFNVLERPEVEESFNSGWTPTLVFEDADGREYRRSQGYLDAGRFLGEASLARLAAAIIEQDFEAATERLDEASELTEGDLMRRLEALYWSAVVAYKLSGARRDLVEGWERLT